MRDARMKYQAIATLSLLSSAAAMGLRRAEEDTCSICPDVAIFDECPTYGDENSCNAAPGCGWCDNPPQHGPHCRVSCTCGDDTPPSPSLWQACNYNSDGVAQNNVQHWPLVFEIGHERSPECWCGLAEPDDSDGLTVGPNSDLDANPPIRSWEWAQLRAWLAKPAAHLLKKLLGWDEESINDTQRGYLTGHAAASKGTEGFLEDAVEEDNIEGKREDRANSIGEFTGTVNAQGLPWAMEFAHQSPPTNSIEDPRQPGEVGFTNAALIDAPAKANGIAIPGGGTFG